MSKIFYGDQEIVSKEEQGNDVILKLSNETEVIVNKKILPYSITEVSVDLTTLRNNRMRPVIQAVLQVLLDYDVYPFEPMTEIPYILSRVKDSFLDNYKKATNKKMGISEDKIRMSDIDKVLQENDK
jgi:hypothetical protein